MIKHGDPKAKPGLRIHLISMDTEDPNPIDSGLEGTIDRVDDMGTIHVNWDDGRRLGVIPGVDDYQILPTEDEQITPDEFMSIFNENKGKKVLEKLRKSPISKPINKMFKSAANKNSIKIESEKIKGGEAKGMSSKDLAKKHKVDIKDIEKEIKVGTKIEMEHTDSKEIAKEIAMDHISEFPDYYTNKKHGVKASEKGLEKDLEETTSAGSAGAYNAPLFGKQTTIRKPKAKKLASNIITKGDLKNPLGKIYSMSPKTESKKFKVGELISEITKIQSLKMRNLEGAFDGDPWVGKGGWLRKDELTWPGGEISDILAKMDIDWGDSDLTLTDKETDKINEGWLFKTKEDKLVLNILKRVKERYPDNVKLERGYRGGENDLPNWGNPIIFTLPGIKREAKINVKCYNVPYQGGTECSLQVNYKDLDASKWAIKKLYNFFFEKIHDETKLKLDREIESDLTDPGYAEDVFDMLDDEDIVSEGKKKKESPIHKKKWERCVKDVKKQNKKDGKDYNPYAVCTASIGYEGSIKKPHRRKDKEVLGEEITTGNDIIDTLLGIFITSRLAGVKTKEIPQYLAELGPELILYFIKFLRRFGYSVDVDYIRDNWNNLLKKALGKYYKEGGIVEPLKDIVWDGGTINYGDETSNTYEPRKRKHNSDEEELDEATTFSSVFGGDFPVTPFMFAKKGKHIPSKKPIWKGGKIVQKTNKADLLGEQTEVEDSPIPGVTSAQFRDELMDVWGLQNVEFIKKGVYSTDSKEEYVLNNEGFINTPKEDRPRISSLNGKTIMTWIQDMEYSIQELNKVKWVKGGKFVKIKDKCAKYNNQPHCSQGAIDNPLELSDTAFESVKKVSKKTGIKEGEILNRIKAKLKGVTPEQMEYNKEHGLPIWWQGSKEGFYEKMEPRKNNRGSN